ncbi:flagellin [Aurantimonas sp. 22II-16-19i]|uniref:flagellin N-terminal helical domain-containing protein n=1 Tax=Aurantimonas sp. 22II-16-19i TaxID=1317114 RepID=UPI0009F7ADE1|nr:flagellin [Aurantimonas sp. 22II-16-19i]ORE95061.1 Flagellin D [Aurantimonas sp. 22II-16-19i]
MTSIITNVAAMTALQTLQQTNRAMEETQNKISTGYRVAEAKDNAAYWSIATGMRSDNSAMSAVYDSLGIGEATVDSAYTGLASAKDVLDTIKAKLTAGSADGVDKAKVQDEIKSLQEQLRTIADSSSFSGQNWLSTGSSSSLTKEIVSSLSRSSDGALNVGSITVDITDIRLFSDNGAGTDTGILNKTIDLTKYTNTSGVATTVETTAVSFAAADDLVTFSVKQGGAAAKTVEITDQTLLDAGLTDTTIRSNADLAAVLKQALKDADITGIDVTIDATDNVVFGSTDDFSLGDAVASGTTGLTATSLGLNTTAATTSPASAGAISVMDIDISLSTITAADVNNYIRVVDSALSQVTTAASTLGAIQNRVSMQKDFVSKLMDTIDKGVGTLVDADMTEESTRLKALQTQQQLGVQALSIANSSSQAIMQLFQN